MRFVVIKTGCVVRSGSELRKFLDLRVWSLGSLWRLLNCDCVTFDLRVSVGSVLNIIFHVCDQVFSKIRSFWLNVDHRRLFIFDVNVLFVHWVVDYKGVFFRSKCIFVIWVLRHWGSSFSILKLTNRLFCRMFCCLLVGSLIMQKFLLVLSCFWVKKERLMLMIGQILFNTPCFIICFQLRNFIKSNRFLSSCSSALRLNSLMDSVPVNQIILIGVLSLKTWVDVRLNSLIFIKDLRVESNALWFVLRFYVYSSTSFLWSKLLGCILKALRIRLDWAAFYLGVSFGVFIDWALTSFLVFQSLCS